MKRETIRPPGAVSSPNLTPGIKVGDTIYVSGQVALDAEGRIVGEGDFAVQAELVFQSLERVLKEAGASLGDVVKVTNFLVDAAHFPSFNAMRRRFFPEDPPASTTVIVKELARPELLIEIEAVAVVPS